MSVLFAILLWLTTATPTMVPGQAMRPAGSHQASENALTITYIGNEGVMISWKDEKVIIDALHRYGNALYERVPEERIDSIILGKPPFDGIDLVLVTHIHADHFDAESVGRLLKNNPTARLVSSGQVADAIEQSFHDYDEIAVRVERVSPSWKQTVQLNLNEIDLKVLGMRHGSQRFRDIVNTGFVVTLGGKTLLHIGDADGTIENLEHFDLTRIGIDIGFIPYWFLSDPRFQPLLNSYIKPGHIIAVHIPPSEANKVTREIKDLHPQADSFTTPLQKRVFPQ